jgi:hypothetical protein
MSKTKTVTRTKDTWRQLSALDAAAQTQPADVKPAVAATTSYAMQDGICLTCNHRPKCLFFKAARRPILFCDEFDNQTSDAHVEDPQTVLLVDGHSYEQGPLPSICVNCDNRLTCMHRKPDEPVLECEDYQ